MPKKIKFLTIIITLEGIEKMTTELCEEYFFDQRCMKTAKTTVMAPQF